MTKERKLDRSDSVTRKKAELQARGVRIPEELAGELEKTCNAPAVRTGRIVLCLESPEKNGGLVPVFIVNGKRSASSPLHLVKSGSGSYEVWAGEERYADVTLLPRPRFYDRLTASGVPMHKLAVIVGPGHLRSVVNQRCYYHRIGRPCKFCAVHRWWNASLEKALPEIAEAVATGVEEGTVEHVSLTTATLNTRGKGLEDLAATAELIRDRVNVPLMLEFEPLSDDALLEYLLLVAKHAGVTTVSSNIECFDARLRPGIMPEKGRIPVADYVKTWEKCREIFGANEVFTVAVVGIGEDDASIIGGVEMAAAHGVMTFLVPHSPAVGAIYENMTAPSADRMLSLYERAVAIYRKYGLDICASRAGCVRGGGFSAIKDVARFGI